MDANTIKETMTKMGRGRQITAGSALLAAIAVMLPWYGIKEEFFDDLSYRGSSWTFGWMGAVLLIAAGALVVAPAFGKSVDTDAVKGEQMAFGAAALGTLLWVIRFISVPGVGFFEVLERQIGVYLALLAAIGVMTGVVMTLKHEGIAIPKPADLRAMGSAAKAAVPAMPTVGSVAQGVTADRATAQPPVPSPAPPSPAAPAPAPMAAPPTIVPASHTPPAPAPGPAAVPPSAPGVPPAPTPAPGPASTPNTF